jgi:hypothetical protein
MRDSIRAADYTIDFVIDPGLDIDRCWLVEINHLVSCLLTANVFAAVVALL